MPTPELERVAAAQAEVDVAEAIVRSVVAEARAAGESWRLTGEAVGISAEAARQRWARAAGPRGVPDRSAPASRRPKPPRTDAPVLRRLVAGQAGFSRLAGPSPRP